jgi:hypothetical protein
MADIDGVLSRTSECHKDAAHLQQPLDTSVNDSRTPALFGVFLEVAGGTTAAVGVTIDLRLVILDTKEVWAGFIRLLTDSLSACTGPKKAEKVTKADRLTSAQTYVKFSTSLVYLSQTRAQADKVKGNFFFLFRSYNNVYQGCFQ